LLESLDGGRIESGLNGGQPLALGFVLMGEQVRHGASLQVSVIIWRQVSTAA
jgi:hypothetical protein